MYGNFEPFQIHLLYIYSDTEGEVLRGEITHVCLNSCHTYEALSYVRGDLTLHRLRTEEYPCW
jgi:hypothetical protein